MNGQSYSTLWKQVKEAEQSDLPRTQYDVLMKIAAKSHREKQPGQLMKAELEGARVMAEISPDSLLPAVERMERRMTAEDDVVLKTVYQVILHRIFRFNSDLGRTSDNIVLTPDLCKKLAATKAVDYEPLLEKGVDSRLFNDDLLSVIGYELSQFDPLHDYYCSVGNRKAAMLTALESLRQQQPWGSVELNKSEYLQRLDSLISVYGDLEECGEVAIERGNYMANYTNATAAEKWLYINLALDRWGSWKGMNELRNAQRQLTAPMFCTLAVSNTGIPNKPQKMEFRQIRNIRQLTMRLYSVKAQGDTRLDAQSDEGYRKLKPLLTPLPFEVTRRYVGKAEYDVFEDSIELQGLPEGVYLIEMESLPASQVSRQLYYVSNVRILNQGLPDNKVRYVAVNATTGQPLKKAHIRLTADNKTLMNLLTDDNGEAVATLTGRQSHMVFGYTERDKFCPPFNGRPIFNHYDNDRHLERVQLFTDRALYRPGQTVHAAAVAYSVDRGFEHKVLPGKQLTLMLRDANGKVVGEKKVETDSYGTATADFTLPTGLLNGEFSITTTGGTCWLRVEEYKRPTFEVKFPEVNQHYEDGDTVQVLATARSYAGVPVQGAKVCYTVVRRFAWWWMSYNSYWKRGYIGTSSEEEEIADGEAVTAADGTFKVDIPLAMPQNMYPQFYNFVCTATVTDQGGETHEAQLSLPLGNRKTAFSCDLRDKILMEEAPKLTFHLRNAAGIDVNSALRYRFDGGKWLEARTMQPKDIPALKSGGHKLEAVCESDTLDMDFTVFSLDDKQPAVKTDCWTYSSSAVFPSDGTPVTIQVGSSDADVHIVYSIVSDKKVVESGFVDKTNELLNLKLIYKEEYGNGLTFACAWVKEGKVYQYVREITRLLPDKRLTLEWTTFRDRLTPGQKEEWTLTVKGPDGKAADAQLLATLYDKSLDQIRLHDISLRPITSVCAPFTQFRAGSWPSLLFSAMKPISYLQQLELELTHFDESIFPVPRLMMAKTMRLGSVGSARKVFGNSSADVFELKEVAVAAQSAAPQFEGLAVSPIDESLGEGRIAGFDLDGNNGGRETAEENYVRQNLQETAFFYPQLQTDKDGRVAVKFTLPESVTTWRFLGVAHTADLCYGMIGGEAVASKDVIIQPNVPRFVRQGDQAVVTARIINTSGKSLTGTARLVVFDPETEVVVVESTQKVTLTADSTVSVSFGCAPDDSWPSLIVCRLTVSGKGFSDGEQHYLPVLPDKERVTVTVPFNQNSPGTKSIDLTQLFPKHQGRQNVQNAPKLTVEYTNNPAWLMIQALPAVGHPHDDCAVCQAASLYANAIGKYIVDRVPQAKMVFEQWQRESTQTTSLSSQLEKNQELKDIVLSETPWVGDADREGEQRQRLANFFDENTMRQCISSATEKLRMLQRSDGSWSWWPGMKGSTFMTIAVSEMLVRLAAMTGQRQELLDGAFKYLGKEMSDLVAEMKKEEKKGYRQTFPSHTALQWLYICKLDGRMLPATVQQANSYLLGLLKKDQQNQTIYEKALSAIILDSKQYIKSLKEYTVYKEEMGRYYDTPRAGYSWCDYRIPAQVAAIEAIRRLTPDDRQTLEEMRRWLLQQKRSQAWDTPLNSVDAVYAFLEPMGTTSPMGPIGAMSSISVDGEPLDLPKGTAGLGFVKTSQLYGGEKTLAVEKHSEGTSWGTVYAQFMQPTAEVKDQSSGISVKRAILLGSKETQNAPTALKVGDRVIVRLTIHCERDLDFVQLQDKRAACLEPVNQLSGYDWRGGYYCSLRDNTTNYFFDRLSKGNHVIETEYFIDRSGEYQTGTCTVQCAYAPEYRGMTNSQTIKVE